MRTVRKVAGMAFVIENTWKNIALISPSTAKTFKSFLRTF